MDAADGWPDWEFGPEHLEALGEYVDPVAMEEFLPQHLADARHQEQGDYRDAVLGLAEELYDYFRNRRLRYAGMPYTAGRQNQDGKLVKQRIRPSHVVFDGVATCLDLSLVYAGLALALGIRAFIAVRFDPPAHAMVVLDLERLDPAGPVEGRAVPVGFVPAASDRPAVWHSESGVEFGDRWLAIDVVRATVVRATKAGSASFDDALKAPHKRLSESGWWLLDVDAQAALVARQNHGVVFRHRPPDEANSARIHGYLPRRPAFRKYDSRGKDIEELRRLLDDNREQARGLGVVLLGPRGVGKSMLAHHLAGQVDNGYGWFLNAPDRGALIRELAARERAERGRGQERFEDAAVDETLARMALQRLRSSVSSWVVVLDNVDRALDPAMAEFVPRPGSPGQTVIVTTTERAWLSEAARRGWSCLPIAPLDTEHDLPPELTRAAGDLPVSVEPVRAMVDKGYPVPEHAPVGPALVWQMLRNGARERCAQPEAVLRLVRLLAWVPSGPVTCRAMPLDSHVEAADQLAELNIVTVVDRQVALAGRAEPVLQMHGLVAEAIRADTLDHHPDEAIRALRVLLTDEDWGHTVLIQAADAGALKTLEADVDGLEPRLTGELHGLLRHGLGSVRERRGPVSASEPHFKRAQELLDPDVHPEETAEARIGLTRIRYHQRGRRLDLGPAYWMQQQQGLRAAQELLARTTDHRFRQMHEQANALYWLIERDVTVALLGDGPEKLPALLKLLDELTRSYHRRLILDGQRPPDGGFPVGYRPSLDCSMTVDRAYYNLGGAYLRVAQERARLLADAAEPNPAGAVRQIVGDLERSEEVYTHTQLIRERRLGGAQHPHVAACINGLALTRYYRAVLTGEWAELIEALRYAQAAMANRYGIRADLGGEAPPAALGDSDLGKSLDVALKVLTAVRLVAAHSRNGLGGRSELAIDPVAAVRRFASASDEAMWLVATKVREADGEARDTLARQAAGGPGGPPAEATGPLAR